LIQVIATIDELAEQIAELDERISSRTEEGPRMPL
jgi:hypothetical protein